MLSRVTLAPLIALGLILSTGVADAQVALRFKYVKGQKNTYEVQQDMKITQSITGKNIDMDLKQTMEFTQTVDEVNADGSAKVTTKFQRVKMAMKGPVEVDLDSANLQEDDENAVAKAMGSVVKALARIEFTATHKTDGEIADLKIPEALVKEFKSMPGSAQMGDLFSEQGIKQMMSQSGLVLKKEPVSVGDSWTQKVTNKLPFGKLTGEMKYTYQGPETVDGKTLQKIAFTPNTTFAPEGEAALALKINSQKGSGVILFDNEAGRMQQMNLDQVIEMSVGVLNQNIDQIVTQKIAVKLRK